MYRVLLFLLSLFAIVFFYVNTMGTDILSTKENFTADFKDILPIQIGGDNKSIMVPNTIGGNDVESNNPYINFQGDVRIKKEMCIEFAKGFSKEVNAGKIGYQYFSTNALDIVGAGGAPRIVKIWDKLETDTIKANKTLSCAELNTGPLKAGNIECGSLNANTIKADNTMECQSLNITSDERVKHKKTVLDVNDSLAQIKQLKPTQFEFKSGCQPVYGFIAQEVQQVVPTCVTSQKSYIANIHDTATLTGNQLTFKHFHTKDLEYKKEVKLYPKLKLKRDGYERHVSVTRIVDEHTVQVKKEKEKDQDHKLEDGEYLVYGQEVDDFLTIDQNQLFALTTSAVKALDANQQALANEQNKISNQQQAQDTRVQELELQLQEEREQNKMTLHRILQRISSLEAN